MANSIPNPTPRNVKFTPPNQFLKDRPPRYQPNGVKIEPRVKFNEDPRMQYEKLNPDRAGGDKPGFEWGKAPNGNWYKIPVEGGTVVASAGFLSKILPWIYACVIVILLILLLRIYITRSWRWFIIWASSESSNVNSWEESSEIEQRINSPRTTRKNY